MDTTIENTASSQPADRPPVTVDELKALLARREAAVPMLLAGQRAGRHRPAGCTRSPRPLGVEISYFFEGLARECAVEPNAQQRLLLELTRDFTAIPNRKVQEAFCAVARAVAAVEPEAENGAKPARASRTRPKSATKAG
jgi:hypothetical protein